MIFLRKLWANVLLRYALSLCLLVLVVLSVKPQHIAVALQSARPQYLLVALALTIPFIYLKSLRWYLILQAAQIDATFSEATLSMLGGMGLALLTPARLGELVRVAYLRDARKWKIGGLVMIDKALDVLILCALSILGAGKLLGAPAGLAFAALTIVGLALVYKAGAASQIFERFSAELPLRSKLESLWSSLDALSATSTTVFLLLTLSAFAIVLLQFGIVLLSWRAWSPDIVFLTFPLVILTNVVPLTVAGLGLREGSAALLLSHYGVSAADAAVAALLMFTMNTALPGLVGVLLPATSRRTPAAPRHSLDHP